MNNSKTSGFSLIELSIVLIIIGLLVAGVTGGQSLIESARVRAVINEIENIKRGVNTYYVAKGRLPGDPTNTGIMGSWDNDYDFSTDSDYGSYVNVSNAPFVDMEREGILDFDEDNEDIINALGEYESGHFTSKVFKNTFYEFSNFSEEDVNNAGGEEKLIMKSLYNKNLLELHNKYIFLPVKIISAIDQKIDDGIYNTGSAIGRCGYEDEIFSNIYYSYDDIISEDDSACAGIMFKLDL